MKRVLITGATGFVGANLARRLLHEAHQVHLLLYPGSSPWRVREIRADVRCHEVDLVDRDAVVRAVAHIRPDWVFHLAVHGAYSSQSDLHRMLQTNIAGTINLIDACIRTGCEVVVNTGSSSEYGFKDHAPTEQESLDPNSHYAITKASATMFCRHAAQRWEGRLPTLRLYSVYGPYEEPSRLLPTLILRGLDGKLPPLVHPDIARDYVYVDDVTTAYLLAATQPDQERGAIYNVGTGVQTSLRQVVEVARRMLGIAAEPDWGSMPERQWDTTVWVADSRKARRLLGWQPAHSFEQGLQATVNWFQEHPSLLGYYQSQLLARHGHR